MDEHASGDVGEKGIGRDRAPRVIGGVIAVSLALLGVIYLFGDDDADIRRAKEGERAERQRLIEETRMTAMTAQQESEDRESEAPGTAGSYEPYVPSKVARAANGRVVLFFRESGCSTCETLDADIRENLPSIPDGLTILDVDADRESDLKRTYRVVDRHTLVQVDRDGNELGRWVGTPRLAGIVSEVR